METNTVVIHYCPGCRWLTRAAWMAQELLITFEQQLTELTLRPAGSGVFQIYANDQLVWCRKLDIGFPDIATLKKRVRDVISPEKSLGHTDGQAENVGPIGER